MSRPRGLRPIAELAAARPHGTRLRYLSGCHCVPCRAANSRYEVARAAARRRGESNGVVDAGAARDWLRRLSRAGVGRKTVAELTGVAASIVQGIARGKRPRARAATVRAILAVSPRATAPGVVVPADAAWRRLRELTEEGYTRTYLARCLGSRSRTPALQVGRRRITKATALKVERLHRRLTS